MKQFLCELLFSCSLLGAGAAPIDELTYGTVLYEYFQEEHQAALLNAMVAEKQGRRGEDTIRFDLAAGSFAFADGMYAFANETFAAVPETEIDELDRMRLAFHLSLEYHRRQDWQPLAEQLDKIQLGETWFGRERLHPEVEYMRGELALNQGHFDVAQQHFGLMDETDPLRAYGLFNLGVAYREAEQLPEARKTFRTLSKMPVYDDEAFDLTQRARLALALIARQQQKTETAETVLSALPGEGRYQEVAMAAYGGLAMDNEEYELAARIWMTLQQQDYWTSSTATARLGFPMSLERMAGQGRATTEMALVQFQAAEQSFSARLTDLQQLSTDAQDPAWVQDLLHVFAADDRGGEHMQVMMQNWQERLGHTDWLEWLATDRVNQALTQWRDLNGMEDWLSAMPDKVHALQAVSHEQQRRGHQARELLHGDGLLAKRAQLQQRLEQSSANLQALVAAQPEMTQAWMWQLANDDERALLSDLAAKQELTKHMNERDRAKWTARIKRLQGLVFYTLVDDSASRLQAMRKQHKALAGLLQDIDQRIARVADAKHDFEATVGTDFLVFLERADTITAKVHTARVNRETYLANEIRGRMQREMQQVEQYLLVTRIAIARATDQLAMAGTPGTTGTTGLPQ